MTILGFVVVGATILATSFLSGVFGIAGGMVLVGILLVFLDVGAAMMLFSVVQLAGTTWRLVWWRHFVRVGLVLPYIGGAVIAILGMRLVALVPSKAIVYLGLGLVPFVVEAIPSKLRPHIERRGIPLFTGLVSTIVQVLAGAAGPLLDIFFQKSSLDRKTTVATKAVCQSTGHVLRLSYFASLGNVAAAFDGHSFPVWAYLPAIGLSIAGATLAPLILERMTDEVFRRWTRAMILGMSCIYVVRGLLLLGYDG